MPDYYAILDVHKTATQEALKKAYRALAKKHHPDLQPGNAVAESKFKEINEAYAILSDPEKRKEYDAKRANSTKKQTAEPPQTVDPPDIVGMRQGFERFFGFDPNSGKVAAEEKCNPQNPLDTSDLFERFMGFHK